MKENPRMMQTHEREDSENLCGAAFKHDAAMHDVTGY